MASVYDLIVIGSGPAGQRAAIYGAKLGKKVALVEMREVVGGACINTGTIPSKTMREAVLHLSGYNYKSIYGMNYRVKERITMADLAFRVQHVIKTEIDVTEAQLSRNNIEMLTGVASFVDPTQLQGLQRLRGQERPHRHGHQARQLAQGSHQRHYHHQLRPGPEPRYSAEDHDHRRWWRHRSGVLLHVCRAWRSRHPHRAPSTAAGVRRSGDH
jgi:pyruvate/2-oxoglutarate dehydrogenase complex dihydrolipoamide dehydrogenase (E3) component